MGSHVRPTMTALAATVLIAATATGALAAGEQTPATPGISGKVAIEIQNDNNYRSDDAGAEHSQLYTTTEPELTARLLPGLSLFVHGVLEPVRGPAPAEDRAFEDHGFFVEDLFVAYETGRHAFKAGKFTPNFGIAWDAAPGLYGTDVAEANYEFTERIGLGAAVGFGAGAAGRHTLSASTFFLDTTALHGALGRGREPATLDRADGGPSNTGDFSSFAVALDGGEFEALPGLRYHAAFIHQAAGEGDSADVNGFALAAAHRFGLGSGVSLAPLVEFVRLGDAEGIAGRDRTLITAAARLAWQGWNLALAWTGRETDAPGGGATDDTHVQLSAGYEFDFGLAVDAGWLIDDTDDVETRTFGLLLAYTVAF